MRLALACSPAGMLLAARHGLHCGRVPRRRGPSARRQRTRPRAPRLRPPARQPPPARRRARPRRGHDRDRGLRPRLHARRRLRSGRRHLRGQLHEHREHPPRPDVRRRHQLLAEAGRDRDRHGHDPRRRALVHLLASRATSDAGMTGQVTVGSSAAMPGMRESPPRRGPAAPAAASARRSRTPTPRRTSLRDPKAPGAHDRHGPRHRPPDHREGHDRRQGLRRPCLDVRRHRPRPRRSG